MTITSANNKSSVNPSDKKVKIVHEDGFNFIDDDDDEEILLYEDYIHEHADDMTFNAAKYHEDFQADLNDNDNDILADIPLVAPEPVSPVVVPSVTPSVKPVVKPTPNVTANPSRPAPGAGQPSARPVNPGTQPTTANPNKLTVLNSASKPTNGNQPVPSKNGVVASVSDQEPDLVLVQDNPSPAVVVKPAPVVVTPKPKPPVNKPSVIAPVVNPTSTQFAFDDPICDGVIDGNETYFIDPKRTNSQYKGDDKEYQIYQTEDMAYADNVEDSYFINNIVLSGTAYKPLFNIKYIFSATYLSLWCAVSVALIALIALGAFAQIQNYKSNFIDTDYIPLSLGAVISLSLLTYEIVNTARYHIYRNEFVAGKKVDSNDFDHVNAIYKHNNMWQGFMLWSLLSLTFIFLVTIFVIYLVNNKSFDIKFENHKTYLAFYGSIGTYVILFVFMVVVIAGFLVMNKIIEKDPYFEKSKAISQYKEISKSSYKIGLITFCCITIVGVCVYLIVDTVMKKQQQNKKNKPVYKYQ